MDLISLAYFIEVSKDLHITRTANRLFISQQTLSNRIQKLEEYYGTPLLERKPSLALTYAGELVLEYAKKTVAENKNLLDQIADISRNERGVITFCASRLRTGHSLPYILPSFSKEYPKVELRVLEANSAATEKKILNGEADIGLVTRPAADRLIQSTLLIKDQVYFCVRRSLLELYTEDTEAWIEHAKNGIDPIELPDIPLCVLNNHLGERILNHYRESGVKYNEYMSCTYINLGVAVSLSGLAACFATHTGMGYFTNQEVPQDYLVLPIMMSGKSVTQDVYVICMKDRYKTSYMNRFIEMMTAYYQSVVETGVDTLVHGA